ncbi:hypothetical protein HK099_003784 [Clydaea vesicula]|uniref:RNA-binding protein n=1 Tax=Clydaea vesicula TaxID=447962 RepID=A0AAD5U5U5_9FUNG|nr:hypothetical protein HK099_003784 [Clydaea vesicula]
MSYCNDYADGVNPTDWICINCGINNFERRVICFQCSSPKPDAPLPKDFHNDGSRDIGDIPNNILICRGFDPICTTQTIYEHFKGFSNVKRCRLIVDRVTNLSWGFCFIEYTDVQSAAATLSDLLINKNNSFINGFLLQVTYSHPNSFLPVYAETPYGLKTYDSQGKCFYKVYWDENAYSVNYPNIEDEPPVPEAVKSATKKKVQKVQKAAIVASGAPTKLTDEEKMNAFFDSLEPLEEKGVKRVHEEDDVNKRPKKVHARLQQWEKKKLEVKDDSNFESPSATVTTFQTMSDEQLLKLLPTNEELNKKYLDDKKFCCLLCKRKFGKLEEVEKHILKSKLHADNLEKLKKELVEEKKMEGLNQYRNRAKERRDVFGNFEKDNSSKEEEERYQATTSQDKTIGVSNIGNRMLVKMGWNQGKGLGKEGEGIVEPVKAVIFKKGQGIGSGSGFKRR